jgi:2-polyprenyl-6-methoxyphenol hydroxylase-like FAD-dependent oxidoreductase
MQPTTVLISGAGIAGMTIAYWLSRHGLRVTVVERSAGQRSSGAPVDVRGPAADIAERMGIVPRLRDAATHVDGMRFIDSKGRVAARVDTRALQRASASPDIELARGDLAAILHEASRDSAELIFNDAVRAVAQDATGVDVTFEREPPRRFDLVIGADGLHSGVRRVVFGPEGQFVQHVGLYVATTPLARSYAGADRDISMFNAPGRSATIHPARGRALAAFIFWRDAIAGLEHHDTEQHRRILQDTYGSDGWQVPALMDEVRATSDLYFDAVSRVRMAHWSLGRVVLVGDAASCVSLFGDGSTLAMAGGYTLAEALAEHEHDYAAAFGEYESRHRRLVDPRQKSVVLGAWLLVPKTGAAIAIRNSVLRLAPLMVGAQWVRRGATLLSRQQHELHPQPGG